MLTFRLVAKGKEVGGELLLGVKGRGVRSASTWISWDQRGERVCSLEVVREGRGESFYTENERRKNKRRSSVFIPCLFKKEGEMS